MPFIKQLLLLQSLFPSLSTSPLHGHMENDTFWVGDRRITDRLQFLYITCVSATVTSEVSHEGNDERISIARMSLVRTSSALRVESMSKPMRVYLNKKPQMGIWECFVPLPEQRDVLSLSHPERDRSNIANAPNALNLLNKAYQVCLGAAGYLSFIKPLRPIRV